MRKRRDGQKKTVEVCVKCKGREAEAIMKDEVEQKRKKVKRQEKEERTKEKRENK